MGMLYRRADVGKEWQDDRMDRMRFREQTHWKVMRKRKLIVITVLALTAAMLGVFLLTRDYGPAVVVQGNFSAKDVAEIKSAVRQQLWHEALPDFSMQTIRAFPQMAKRALTTHLISIEGIGSVGSERPITSFIQQQFGFPPGCRSKRHSACLVFRQTIGWILQRTVQQGGPGRDLWRRCWTDFSGLANEWEVAEPVAHKLWRKKR